jgi:hypothetical protein
MSAAARLGTYFSTKEMVSSHHVAHANISLKKYYRHSLQQRRWFLITMSLSLLWPAPRSAE